MRREKRKMMLRLTPRLVIWGLPEPTSTAQWDFWSCSHFEAVMLVIHMSKKHLQLRKDTSCAWSIRCLIQRGVVLLYRLKHVPVASSSSLEECYNRKYPCFSTEGLAGIVCCSKENIRLWSELYIHTCWEDSANDCDWKQNRKIG